MQLVTGKLGEKKGAERGEEEAGEGGSLTRPRARRSLSGDPPPLPPRPKILYYFSTFHPLISGESRKSLVFSAPKEL